MDIGKAYTNCGKTVLVKKKLLSFLVFLHNDVAASITPFILTLPLTGFFCSSHLDLPSLPLINIERHLSQPSDWTGVLFLLEDYLQVRCAATLLLHFFFCKLLRWRPFRPCFSLRISVVICPLMSFGVGGALVGGLRAAHSSHCVSRLWLPLSVS